MLRIDIAWNFTSPLLSTIVGTVTIIEVNIQNLKDKKEISTFRIRKGPSSTGFEIINPLIDMPKGFELIRDELTIMINSYYAGFKLLKRQHHWITDRKLEQKQKEKNERINKKSYGQMQE